MAADMEASMFSMLNMHVCACVCMCVHACEHACMHGTPPSTTLIPTPNTHPPICHPPREVDPQNHLKFDNTSTYQDISIPFEDLKSVKNSLPMGECVIWWMGGHSLGWVTMGGITLKSLKIQEQCFDWIKMTFKYLIDDDLWFQRDTPTHWQKM